MGAPKGNRYGVDSGNFFKPKKYTPEEWGQVFIEYLGEREETLWNKKEAIKSGDMAGTTMDVPHQLPLSIESFCVYAGISRQTFINYEKGGKYEEYFEVTTRMREVVEADQLDGAMVGAYNPNIVARKLGLAEKQEVKADVTTASKIDWSKLSVEESKILLKAIEQNKANIADK